MMASYIGGYAESRFQTSVDKNFFCPICTDVLKDPLQCHNQHYFCAVCLTKHFKNSQTCPICMAKLTEETLSKPPRIVTDYLDGLIINCDHNERGCIELMELGMLKTHAAVCNYRPVVCSSERCSATVNMKDLEEHETNLCEYRLIHCQECDEVMSVKKYGKHACLLRKEVDEMKAVLFDIKHQVTKIQDTQDRKFEEVLAGIRKLTSASPFVPAKTVVSPISSTSIGRQEDNIVVLGGRFDGTSLNSVEMYSTINQTWTPLAPMKECRASATAHCYNDQIIVTGGHNNWVPTNSTETTFLGLLPEQHLYSSPFELPEKCCGHKTLIHDDYLWTVGGSSVKGSSSRAISRVSLQPPFSLTLEGQMPQPLSYHGLQIVGNKILIIGGSTTGFIKGIVDTVLSYNITRRKFVHMVPLPFPMVDMATVQIGEDVLIIGGTNKRGHSLNTVFKYNSTTMQCTQLPSMKYKRAECAAVISGHKVFVMGGLGYSHGKVYHNSVECFDLHRQVWTEIPPMNEAKDKLAAVRVPAHLF